MIVQKSNDMQKLVRARESAARAFSQPIARVLAKTGISPTALTWTGFLIALGGGALIALGYPFIAGVAVLVGAAFDMLDGALARLTNRVTRFGAVLDSTLDRLGEVAVLLGILVAYALSGSVAGILLTGLALPGSLLVSYLRARAEAISLDCKVGLFTRTERVVIVSLGLLFSRFDYALIAALAIIVFFSFLTVAQRLLYIWQQTKVK
ncbi:MAG: CDP-alcohol phosphatidyltransferase family protein [Chloroflexota bacterium]